MKSVLSHESDAGRGHTEPSVEDGPTLACLSAGTAWGACPWGATAGDSREPPEKVALAAAGSAASGHSSQSD